MINHDPAHFSIKPRGLSLVKSNVIIRRVRGTVLLRCLQFASDDRRNVWSFALHVQRASLLSSPLKVKEHGPPSDAPLLVYRPVVALCCFKKALNPYLHIERDFLHDVHSLGECFGHLLHAVEILHRLFDVPVLLQ